MHAHETEPKAAVFFCKTELKTERKLFPADCTPLVGSVNAPIGSRPSSQYSCFVSVPLATEL